jgi:pilus assembly protein Flp/PilA
MKLLRSLLLNTKGASSAEYALILAIVGTGVALAAFVLGESIAAALRAGGSSLP